MGKIKKSFSEFTEENEMLRKKPIKKESRHNLKKHLMDMIEHEDWDELEDELSTEGRSRTR